MVMDEFSYILGGETLAKGRLANPPHPMAKFFESPHVNMTPTYASKYPPGQALFLAAGIRLFGHPWYGVWLSMALMCGCFCWMLQGWVPPAYGFLGALIAVMQFAFSNYWINSYWGGAVAATGGALVIGAVPRLVRNPSVAVAALAMTGVAILAQSRPFEGFVLCAAAGGTLLWWAHRAGTLQSLLQPALLLVILLSLFITGGMIGYYNWRVTGNMLQLPYTVNQRQQGWPPSFWVQPVGPAPKSFRDQAMQNLWQWDRGLYVIAREMPLRVPNQLRKVVYAQFLDGPALPLGLTAVAAVMILIPLRRMRAALIMTAAFFGAILVEKYILAHYLAPGVGLLVVISVAGLRVFGLFRIRGQRVGLLLTSTVMIVACAIFISSIVEHIRSPVDMQDNAMMFRARVLKTLETTPGQHLVLVHYAENHNWHEEHVYNGADIDSQKVVWALDRGRAENEILLNYYRGRTVWLMLPDKPDRRLSELQDADLVRGLPDGKR